MWDEEGLAGVRLWVWMDPLGGRAVFVWKGRGKGEVLGREGLGVGWAGGRVCLTPPWVGLDAKPLACATHARGGGSGVAERY